MSVNRVIAVLATIVPLYGASIGAQSKAPSWDWIIARLENNMATSVIDGVTARNCVLSEPTTAEYMRLGGIASKRQIEPKVLIQLIKRWKCKDETAAGPAARDSTPAAVLPTAAVLPDRHKPSTVQSTDQKRAVADSLTEPMKETSAAESAARLAADARKSAAARELAEKEVAAANKNTAARELAEKEAAAVSKNTAARELAEKEAAAARARDAEDRVKRSGRLMLEASLRGLVDWVNQASGASQPSFEEQTPEAVGKFGKQRWSRKERWTLDEQSIQADVQGAGGVASASVEARWKSPFGPDERRKLMVTVAARVSAQDWVLVSYTVR